MTSKLLTELRWRYGEKRNNARRSSTKAKLLKKSRQIHAMPPATVHQPVKRWYSTIAYGDIASKKVYCRPFDHGRRSPHRRIPAPPSPPNTACCCQHVASRYRSVRDTVVTGSCSAWRHTSRGSRAKNDRVHNNRSARGVTQFPRRFRYFRQPTWGCSAYMVRGKFTPANACGGAVSVKTGITMRKLESRQKDIEGGQPNACMSCGSP